jgi:hypothetical protein
MATARYGLFGAAAAALVIYGCAAAPTAVSALGQGGNAAATAAMAKPARVDNFLLVDTDLRAYELYHMSADKAVVLVAQANGDAALRAQAPALKALKADYAAKGVEVLLLNSSLKDTREGIEAEAKTAGYDAPVLMDSYQLVGESLGVTRSGEALVIDPKTWTVAWRGALTDPGARQALDALAAGKPVTVASAAPGRGAAIDFPARVHKAEIT